MKGKSLKVFFALSAALSLFVILMAGFKEYGSTEPEILEIRVLVSTNGDNLKQQYISQEAGNYGNENEDVRIVLTFVESDTLAFLKLLYAQKGYGYDVVCMGEEALLSAVEQKLVYPVDDLFIRNLGLGFMNRVPQLFMVHTAIDGKLYGVPFLKRKLTVYCRKKPADMGGTVTLEQLLLMAGDNQRYGMPVPVILQDLMLSTDFREGNDQYWGENRYEADTPENRRLLELLAEKIEEGCIVNGDYEALAESYGKGLIDGVILEETVMKQVSKSEMGTGEQWQGDLCIRENVPWLVQSRNCYLVNHGEDHDYERAWSFIEYLMFHEDFSQWEEKENSLAFQRVLTLKNTKAQLMANRMIAEFLQGNKSAGELLLSFQTQADYVLNPPEEQNFD